MKTSIWFLCLFALVLLSQNSFATYQYDLVEPVPGIGHSIPAIPGAKGVEYIPYVIPGPVRFSPQIILGNHLPGAMIGDPDAPLSRTGDGTGVGANDGDVEPTPPDVQADINDVSGDGSSESQDQDPGAGGDPDSAGANGAVLNRMLQQSLQADAQGDRIKAEEIKINHWLDQVSVRFESMLNQFPLTFSDAKNADSISTPIVGDASLNQPEVSALTSSGKGLIFPGWKSNEDIRVSLNNQGYHFDPGGDAAYLYRDIMLRIAPVEQRFYNSLLNRDEDSTTQMSNVTRGKLSDFEQKWLQTMRDAGIQPDTSGQSGSGIYVGAVSPAMKDYYQKRDNAEKTLTTEVTYSVQEFQYKSALFDALKKMTPDSLTEIQIHNADLAEFVSLFGDSQSFFVNVIDKLIDGHPLTAIPLAFYTLVTNKDFVTGEPARAIDRATACLTIGGKMPESVSILLKFSDAFGLTPTDTSNLKKGAGDSK
jgi:hypothetical protein